MDKTATTIHTIQLTTIHTRHLKLTSKYTRQPSIHRVQQGKQHPVKKVLYIVYSILVCADVKVKINSKGSAKQEDESSPVSAWQRQHQAEHQSARTGSNYSSGVDYSPSSSLQSDLASPT
jgi:hypothetical protein